MDNCIHGAQMKMDALALGMLPLNVSSWNMTKWHLVVNYFIIINWPFFFHWLSCTGVIHSPERVEGPFRRQSVSKVCAPLGIYSSYFYQCKHQLAGELHCWEGNMSTCSLSLSLNPCVWSHEWSREMRFHQNHDTHRISIFFIYFFYFNTYMFLHFYLPYVRFLVVGSIRLQFQVGDSCCKALGFIFYLI